MDRNSRWSCKDSSATTVKMVYLVRMQVNARARKLNTLGATRLPERGSAKCLSASEHKVRSEHRLTHAELKPKAPEPCASNDILRRSGCMYNYRFTPPIISSQNVLNVATALKTLVRRCLQELSTFHVPLSLGPIIADLVFQVSATVLMTSSCISDQGCAQI